MNAIPAGLSPNVQDGVALTYRTPQKNFVPSRDAETEHVHQGILIVDLIETDFAAHGGDAHTISIAGNARYDATKKIAVLRPVQGSEP